MNPRGPVPPLVEDVTLRAWWVDGRWDCLFPILDQIARLAARRVLKGDTDSVDDIVSDTLYRCWRHTECPDRVSSFVFRVARNSALDTLKCGYVRRRVHKSAPGNGGRVNVEGEQDEDVALYAVDTADNALDAIIAKENHQRLRVALRKVPDHLRRPLILHTFHRRTAADLAAQWQINEGAMKMRLTRARILLAAVFDASRKEMRHD